MYSSTYFQPGTLPIPQAHRHRHAAPDLITRAQTDGTISVAKKDENNSRILASLAERSLAPSTRQAEQMRALCCP